jgi:serine/threonine protein kinase
MDLLMEEIKVHKQLEHPNIVKCYEIIEKPNYYYFVLEHCPHGTLDAFIKKHEKLKESVTIGIIEQIIAGYKYLLQMKVLHRDLKPPNILKSGPTWKICDFGFSLIGKKAFVGELNVGTPAYMAPEALERTFYSPKTDFFAIGVLCYEMLFGTTPWAHKNEKILLQRMKDRKI